MSADYITPEVLALIGAKSEWVEASNPVESSEVRRFCHATMDANPKYWNAAAMPAARYGGAVAPLAMPVHAFRRHASDPEDPLDAMSDPDFDGVSRTRRVGLPKVPVPLPGILNGGYEYEFYSHALIGERVLRRSSYRDIYQKDGKSGPLVFVVIEDEYVTQDGRPLLKAATTTIMR